MKTIIEMAREAGWKDLRNNDSEMHDHIFMGNIDTLKALAAFVRADERQACAKVVEDLRGQCWAYDHDQIASTIRARGNT